MFNSAGKFFRPLDIRGGGQMSFGIFAASVAPLVAGAVIMHALIMHGLLGEFGYLAMLPPAIVSFAILFTKRDAAERKRIKDCLDQIWRVWAALGFAVVFHGLAVGGRFTVDSVLAGTPILLQSVLFALLAGTLSAYFGLFLAPLSRRS